MRRAAQYGIVLLGLVIVALGLGLMLRSGLGMGAWGAFEQGLAARTGITFGRASQLVGLALILLAWALRQPPTVVTVMNMLLIGEFSDRFLAVLPAAQGLPTQAVYLAAGLAVHSIGVALYLTPGLGSGPREGVMLGLCEALGASVRFTRVCIDLTVLVMALAMRGPIGHGTVIHALGAGPLIQFFLGCCKKALPMAMVKPTASHSPAVACEHSRNRGV
jgi:uncharacterized membrane protein YczE